MFQNQNQPQDNIYRWLFNKKNGILSAGLYSVFDADILPYIFAIVSKEYNCCIILKYFAPH